MLLSTNEIPGLRRMLTVQAKHGASPKAIQALLLWAVDGRYWARGGFGAREKDLSFLAKAIGGPQLLHALQKSHGLASVSTVQRHITVPTLVASIGKPTPEEISQNISNFMNPEIKLPLTYSEGLALPGNVLMFDGVALETKCCYCPRRNATHARICLIEGWPCSYRFSAAIFTSRLIRRLPICGWIKIS
jgi:hypothetical protein